MTTIGAGPLPLYMQVRQHLEEEVLIKETAVGQMLPSEDALALRFGVSRMTVRRAIDQLVSGGRLSRVQGRGTFVMPPRPQARPTGLSRWSFVLIDPDPPLCERVERVEETMPSLRVATALHTLPGEPVIELLVRLNQENSPFGFIIIQVPALLLRDGEPNLDWNLRDGTLCAYLQQRYRLEFGKVVERVRAEAAEEDVVEQLGGALGDPVLHVDSLVFLASGIPAIFLNAYYHGDRYTYRGNLQLLSST